MINEPGPGTSPHAAGREHPNAAVVRALWEATSKGDADGVVAVLHPEVSWSSYGAGDLTGERRGPEQVLDLLAIAGEWVDTMQLVPLEIYANDAGAVMHYRVTAERGGRHLDTEILIVFEVADGRIRSARSVPLDAEANSAFWRATVSTQGTTH